MTQHNTPKTDDLDAEGWFYAVGGIGFLIFVGWSVFSVLPNKWTDPIRYSLEYDINWKQVESESKPTECDWGRAPLGGKGCHFEKREIASNAAARPSAACCSSGAATRDTNAPRADRARQK